MDGEAQNAVVAGLRRGFATLPDARSGDAQIARIRSAFPTQVGVATGAFVSILGELVPPGASTAAQ